jgi:plasmid maintenance system antidote protein VapI
MVKFGLEVHPGEILREQMEEFDLSANGLATRIGVPANRIRRSSTAPEASQRIRLSDSGDFSVRCRSSG